MSATVDEYRQAAAKLPPATVSIEKQGRKWVFTVACNDCDLVVGRYPDWFEHQGCNHFELEDDDDGNG